MIQNSTATTCRNAGGRPKMAEANSEGRESLNVSKNKAQSSVDALFWWGRSKCLALTAGFGLWLRFGRLLDFFSAFVFASHG
jgi:hypothetical protein